MRLVVSAVALAIAAVLSVDVVYVIAAFEKRSAVSETETTEPEVRQPLPERLQQEPSGVTGRDRHPDNGTAEVTVTRGDSLADIAEGFDSVGACDIFAANQHKVANPDVVYAGQQLEIPDREAEPERPCPSTKPEASPEASPPSSGQQVHASVWDRLARCESDGDWSINTGNGFYGGLQFHPDTWVRYGGQEFASMAHHATREQEVVIAERVLEAQGWGAWPACSQKLGLR